MCFSGFCIWNLYLSCKSWADCSDSHHLLLFFRAADQLWDGRYLQNSGVKWRWSWTDLAWSFWCQTGIDYIISNGINAWTDKNLLQESILSCSLPHSIYEHTFIRKYFSKSIKPVGTRLSLKPQNIGQIFICLKDKHWVQASHLLILHNHFVLLVSKSWRTTHFLKAFFFFYMDHDQAWTTQLTSVV